MTRRPGPGSDPIEVLRGIVLRYPEVEEGVSCNRAAFGARGKSFLFAGTGPGGRGVVLLLELRDSLTDAQVRAREQPGTIVVGKTGWVTLRLADGQPLPRGVERWVEESYRVIVAKETGTKKNATATVAKGR